MTTRPERNADILRRRLEGETLKEIGAVHGISATRVRDILAQVIEHATTTEEEREAKRKAKREERARIVAQQRAEYEAKRAREIAEEERRRNESRITVQIARVEPSWQSLNNFGWWLREHEERYRVYRRSNATTIRPGPVSIRRPDPIEPEYDPTFRAADKAIAQWLDGKANETMTVLRLRKLTEVDHAA